MIDKNTEQWGWRRTRRWKTEDGIQARPNGRSRRRIWEALARARSMQMREYIYLGTTPMYFLGASGRIVGGESNTHPPATLRHPHRCAEHKQTHAPRVRVCRRSDTRKIYEQTSSLPRANRPASYGPIQFNFENKQPPLATSVNLFRGRKRIAVCGWATNTGRPRVDLEKLLLRLRSHIPLFNDDIRHRPPQLRIPVNCYTQSSARIRRDRWTFR